MEPEQALLDMEVVEVREDPSISLARKKLDAAKSARQSEGRKGGNTREAKGR